MSLSGDHYLISCTDFRTTNRGENRFAQSQPETPSRSAKRSSVQKSATSVGKIHDSLIEDFPEKPLIPALRSFQSIEDEKGPLSPRVYHSDLMIEPGPTLSLQLIGGELPPDLEDGDF